MNNVKDEYTLIFTNTKEIFAYGTKITPEKSVQDIQKLTKKFGCKGWANIQDPYNQDHTIQFLIPTTEFGDLPVQFRVRKVYVRNRNGLKYYENESYRLLFLEIKTRLLLAKYSSFLESFLSNILTKNNKPLLDNIKAAPEYLALPEKIERKSL